MLNINKYHSQLNKIFDERDKLFPVRDKENSDVMRGVFARYINELFNNTEEQSIDMGLVDSFSSIIDKPVFICGAMKSGTTMLIELLDNHPELVVMPGDSHMINQFCKDRSLSYAERLVELDWRWLQRVINPLGQKPYWFLGEEDSVYVYFIRYLRYWGDLLPFSDTAAFCSVVASLYCANSNRALTPRFWVEKTPDNEFKVGKIVKLFEEAVFIHIMRNPYENTASLKKLYSIRGWAWDIRDVVTRLKKSREEGIKNVKLLGADKYLLLRYEDIVTNVNIEMQKVTKFLELVESGTLLIPTVNGRLAKANSMYKDKQVLGTVLKDSKSRWQSELASHEVEVLSNCFKGESYE